MVCTLLILRVLAFSDCCIFLHCNVVRVRFSIKAAASQLQIACKLRAFFVQISGKLSANCVQIACKSATNQTKNVILTAKGVTRKKPKVLTCSQWIKFHFLLIT